MTAAIHSASVDLSALPPYVLALKDRIAYLSDAQVERVLRAFEIGALAHAGQERKSGEPYITHPVAVAGILAELGLDAETIIAAILHDTLEDTELSREALAAEFGEVVAELVDGVTKLDK
ncbi:MAG TPA: HD domain-containing protein, partial [Rhodanobacter sp.]|nr:HD domain-containing protein [Rhodanobacter sp.]